MQQKEMSYEKCFIPMVRDSLQQETLSLEVVDQLLVCTYIYSFNQKLVDDLQRQHHLFQTNSSLILESE